MRYNQKEISIIKQIYKKINDKIKTRLAEFKNIWNTASDAELFAELVFCILTPQSKALICWEAVKTLVKKDLLINGTISEIAKEIRNVRFMNNKARYIADARTKFFICGKFYIKPVLDKIESNIERRDWLFQNILGIGYKEASHFLRNIGFGYDIAILDRHILKNMMILKVIKEIPKTISRKIYLDLEKKLIDFAIAIDIPVDHLDFVLWYREAGEVFK
jgi:N-glycosylase/DNA lyase